MKIKLFILFAASLCILSGCADNEKEILTDAENSSQKLTCEFNMDLDVFSTKSELIYTFNDAGEVKYLKSSTTVTGDVSDISESEMNSDCLAFEGASGVSCNNVINENSAVQTITYDFDLLGDEILLSSSVFVDTSENIKTTLEAVGYVCK